MSGAGRLIITALAACLLAGVSHAANFDPPQWAYPSTPQGFQPDPDDGKPKHLAGSTRTHTYKQIEDSFAPADWFPMEHPRMPLVPVAQGRRPDVRACSWCHLPNGLGHPQSGSLAGLSADYMTQQLADFKSGARSGPTTELMKPIAGQLTLQEMIDVAAYLGSKMP